MPWIKSCLCQQEKKKTPTISPPIHLLLKSENSSPQAPSHAFRCKVFKKPRPCHLCHQPILNEGSCCRVCKYVCHKVCESKVQIVPILESEPEVMPSTSTNPEDKKNTNDKTDYSYIINLETNNPDADNSHQTTQNKLSNNCEIVENTVEQCQHQIYDINLNNFQQNVHEGKSKSLPRGKRLVTVEVVETKIETEKEKDMLKQRNDLNLFQFCNKNSKIIQDEVYNSNIIKFENPVIKRTQSLPKIVDIRNENGKKIVTVEVVDTTIEPSNIVRSQSLPRKRMDNTVFMSNLSLPLNRQNSFKNETGSIISENLGLNVKRSRSMPKKILHGPKTNKKIVTVEIKETKLERTKPKQNKSQFQKNLSLTRSAKITDDRMNKSQNLHIQKSISNVEVRQTALEHAKPNIPMQNSSVLSINPKVESEITNQTIICNTLPHTKQYAENINKSISTRGFVSQNIKESKINKKHEQNIHAVEDEKLIKRSASLPKIITVEVRQTALERAKPKMHIQRSLSLPRNLRAEIKTVNRMKNYTTLPHTDYQNSIAYERNLTKNNLHSQYISKSCTNNESIEQSNCFITKRRELQDDKLGKNKNITARSVSLPKISNGNIKKYVTVEVTKAIQGHANSVKPIQKSQTLPRNPKVDIDMERQTKINKAYYKTKKYKETFEGYKLKGSSQTFSKTYSGNEEHLIKKTKVQTNSSNNKIDLKNKSLERPLQRSFSIPRCSKRTRFAEIDCFSNECEDSINNVLKIYNDLKNINKITKNQQTAKSNHKSILSKNKYWETQINKHGKDNKDFVTVLESKLERFQPEKVIIVDDNVSTNKSKTTVKFDQPFVSKEKECNVEEIMLQMPVMQKSYILPIPPIRKYLSLPRIATSNNCDNGKLAVENEFFKFNENNTTRNYLSPVNNSRKQFTCTNNKLYKAHSIEEFTSDDNKITSRSYSLPRDVTARLEVHMQSWEAAERFADTSWAIHRQWQSDAAKAFPLMEQNKDSKKVNGKIKIQNHKTVTVEQPKTTPKMQKTVIISEKRHTHEDDIRNGPSTSKMILDDRTSGIYEEALTSQPRPMKSCSNHNANWGMDLSYVTERIISLWFPLSTSQQAYRQGQRQAAHMLTNKHKDNYMVFNLSEPKRTLKSEHKHVKEVGWSYAVAPPLERICSVCKEIDSWLSADQHNIAVLHTRGNKDKLGVVVAAYMHYSNICGSAEQALDRFSMRKFIEDNIGPLQLPSNKRYIDYFAGLLSHNITINAAPLYLTHVTVLGAPSFQHGGCKAFVKVYEGNTPVYTSGVYNVSSGVGQFTINVAGERRRGLQLRGDVFIKCYHRADRSREAVFACQFHTCAVSDYTLSFTKQELDGACTDSRFPTDGAVELHFSPGPDCRLPTPAPTPAVPVTLADDPIVRADSPIGHIRDLDDDDDSDSDDVNHTFGPLDGSIYATVAKKPELSPGAVSSPLTVSMDSGISSAGHQQQTNTTASASPPPTTQPSPLTPEDQHRELDELLSDMMLTVQSIPDYKPQDDITYIDEDDKNIPYHARQDSRPFSYGVNSTMIDESKKLSSPSLVRKASFNKSSGDTLKKVQTQVFPELPLSRQKYNTYSSTSSKSSFSNDTLSKNSSYKDTYSQDSKHAISPDSYSSYSKNSYSQNSFHNKNSNNSYTKRDEIDNIFTESALASSPSAYTREFREEYYKDEMRRCDPLKRSFTENNIRHNPEKLATAYKKVASTVTSPYSDPESLSPPGAFRNQTKSPEYYETYGSNNLTWLQKQQLKLKERREMQLREERQPHETKLISELRQTTRHMRPSASHRSDGYTSDTTTFADDDEDFSIPLHINTTTKSNSPGAVPSRTSSKKYMTTERPFMATKRSYEENYSQNQSPASMLEANPMGHVIKSLTHGTEPLSNNGLLSLAEPDSRKEYNSSNLVGIEDKHTLLDSPCISTLLKKEHIRATALSDLIANLSTGSDKHNNSSACQYREESYWHSQSDSSPPHSASPRPHTPAFPVLPRTPYVSTPSERLPPKSPTTQRRLSYPSSKTYKRWAEAPERKDQPLSPSEITNGNTDYMQTIRSVSATPTHSDWHYSPKSPVHNGSASPTVYYGSRRSSLHSNNEAPQEVSAVHVKFVRDTSEYWYKPTISREEAINVLRNKPPGTFVVRDSNSFPGAFGLALKVATVPTNVQNKSPNNDELVRHFLIEPTSGGVRLRGCANEPAFSSLSALVYQHSITQMALPCRLLLPEGDIKLSENTNNPVQMLLTQGAACNVLYLFTLDMESLTGPHAIKKAVLELFQKLPIPAATTVNFKVNGQGITLTDSKRTLFFRKHYPISTISHCGLDPEEHRWEVSTDEKGPVKSANRIFGFVAKKPTSSTDNQCHIFAELQPEQPAMAIVNFVNKVLNSSGIKPNIV